MKQISSLDLYFLTKELKILTNQRIDSFYYENGVFYLKVYIRYLKELNLDKSQIGNHFLTFKIGKYIYLSKNKKESSHPSSFIAYLRKNYKNSFIRSVEVIENERILKIEIETKISDEKTQINYLFLEIFAPGNIILTDENYIIKNTLSRKKFKDRKIIVKEKYDLPPKKEISIFSISYEKLYSHLLKSDLSVVKFLAIKLGIGGKFAEEICFRANIDKNTLSNQISEQISSKLVEIFAEILSASISAYKTIDEKTNRISDFFPIEFLSVKNKIKVDSFNQVLEEYFSYYEKEVDLREKEFELQLKRLKNRLKKQQEQKKHILCKYERLNSIGNKIYENFSLIDELLKSINKAGKEKGWDYVEKRIKDDKKLKALIKKLDYKNNKIILNID